MNLNFENARELMVKNQLRPNKIKESVILNLFQTIPKEDFVPEGIKNICYNDNNLNILENRGYLKNLHLAQIIDNSNINKNDIVMHIGGLTGYLSTIISKMCKKLVILEENENAYLSLSENLKYYNINNAKIIKNEFNIGCEEKAPFDLIIIDCPLYNLSNKLIDQLNKNNGKLIYIKKIEDNLSKAYKIIRNNNHYLTEYLFDVFSNFHMDKLENKFEF